MFTVFRKVQMSDIRLEMLAEGCYGPASGAKNIPGIKGRTHFFIGHPLDM